MSLREDVQKAFDRLDLVTTEQAANLLSFSQASVQKWCKAGILPSIKLPGGHGSDEYIITLEDLSTFVPPENKKQPRAKRLHVVTRRSGYDIRKQGG